MCTGCTCAELAHRLTWIRGLRVGPLHHGVPARAGNPDTVPTMQFELSACPHDAASIAVAMRALDAHATVTLDAAHGRLEVLTQASAAQVLEKLQWLGCAARLLEQPVHISGGSTCCGSCG